MVIISIQIIQNQVAQLVVACPVNSAADNDRADDTLHIVPLSSRFPVSARHLFHLRLDRCVADLVSPGRFLRREVEQRAHKDSVPLRHPQVVNLGIGQRF